MVVIGKIIENRRIIETAKLYDMTIECPEIARIATPGQIVHVACGEGTTLRRPISICECDGDMVRICYEVRGKGTDFMASRRAGDDIDLLGPLGNGFTVKEGEKALLVGGGIGIYPLLSVGKACASAEAAFGFRNVSLINSLELFENRGIRTSVITDDGSSGRKGFVTELVKEKLAAGGIDVVYVCGPKGMMAAVAGICMEAGVRCEVSMEERMGCGVGACLACVCKTMFVDNQGVTGEKYKRVCMDGPVFDAKEIIWA
ncbi:MAG: dihydroorotate dehydrogenase electron transfer subunit [Ruminococcaceae bacterium]|nr:dihydroorotate dehydrogenase electron transfer subunit [Oscillospiraceae bacterium]